MTLAPPAIKNKEVVYGPKAPEAPSHALQESGKLYRKLTAYYIFRWARPRELTFFLSGVLRLDQPLKPSTPQLLNPSTPQPQSPLE